MDAIRKADERLSIPAKINIALFGPSGTGKTFQARFLPADRTLFVDLEAGMLACGDWRGDDLNVRKLSQKTGMHPWDVSRMIACLLSGPDPADRRSPWAKPDEPYPPYSFEMYEHYKTILNPSIFDNYEFIFVDSITVASRHSFAWSEQQPGAFSEKTGKSDKRGAYGIHGIEMIRWLTVLQHSPKSIIVNGILDREVDDMRRVTWEPQIEGSKAGRELPGIFDQVLTIQDNFQTDQGQLYRAFCTHKQNPWGYPAKDRSGCLEMLEEPNIYKVIQKIQAGVRLDGSVAPV